MSYDKELTKQLLGDVGPLRFNPKVVKVCLCGKRDIVRYKGSKKPSSQYICRKCAINKPEVIEKLSQNATTQWKDNEFRALVTENSKNIWKDADRRKRMSIYASSTENKARLSRLNKSRAYNSASISIQMQKLWKNSEYNSAMQTIATSKKIPRDTIIARCIGAHGDRFDYSTADYINSHEKITITCNTCHKVQKTYIHNHIRNGYCPYCQVSNGQRQIIDYISSIYADETIINDRQMIRPYELDIFMPERHLAIEYHGLYRHSYDYQPEPTFTRRHQTKACQAIQSKIKLLQFWSSEWDCKRDIVKSMIAYHLGVSKVVHARKCQLSEIDYRFFDHNHIQGGRPAAINIGLIHDQKIVAGMSFSRHPNHEWEIIRYANLLGHTVTGGASRLFCDFIKRVNPTNVLSFADLRFSSGQLYSTLGFDLVEITKPNYHYTDARCTTLFSRQQYQKHKLQRRFGSGFNAALSERANCLANGLRILWDAGHMKYVWSK